MFHFTDVHSPPPPINSMLKVAETIMFRRLSRHEIERGIGEGDKKWFRVEVRPTEADLSFGPAEKIAG